MTKKLGVVYVNEVFSTQRSFTHFKYKANNGPHYWVNFFVGDKFIRGREVFERDFLRPANFLERTLFRWYYLTKR